MAKRHSLISAVTLALLTAPAFAQTAETNGAAAPATIGSPMLRNFELKGTRTTPPAPQQPAATPPATTSPAAERPAAPARSTSRAPVPVTARPAPARSTPAFEAAAPAAPTMRDILSGAEAQASLEIPPVADVPAAQSPAPVSAAPFTSTPATPDAALPGYGWWAAVALALLALLGFAWMRSRRTAFAGDGAVLARETFAEAEAAPAPVRPAPAASPAADEALRPWIEIEFNPERVVATATEATVHFELIVKNRGESEAKDVRIQARMFNPSANQKQDINAFFATPADSQGLSIPPKLAARFRSSVVMPKDQVKEIQVQGRSIFVPTVAINILYAWGEGRKGQTSKSYVVGTAKQPDAEKMGPFRLDLGPRVYRQVGGRPLEVARAV